MRSSAIFQNDSVLVDIFAVQRMGHTSYIRITMNDEYAFIINFLLLFLSIFLCRYFLQRRVKSFIKSIDLSLNQNQLKELEWLTSYVVIAFTALFYALYFSLSYSRVLVKFLQQIFQ